MERFYSMQFRLYNLSIHSLKAQQKTTNKERKHDRKATWRPKAKKRLKKKPSFQELSLEKDRPDIFKQTLPCDSIGQTLLCVFLSPYFLSNIVSGVLSVTLGKNKIVAFLRKPLCAQYYMRVWISPLRDIPLFTYQREV